MSPSWAIYPVKIGVLTRFPSVEVRGTLREDVCFPSGVRYLPVHRLPSGAAARRKRFPPDPESWNRGRMIMNGNERPDWNFWCFITSLLDLLIQLAAHR